jgi:murein DD-endopeptidase MepM/ murein hydrolase activator NlpD
VDGRVEVLSGEVGGLQFRLYGTDGVTYIGTHLDAFGRSGNVTAGEVIGRVGDTGNARGGPTHLHFEIHPNDGDPSNPYPTLQKAGC